MSKCIWYVSKYVVPPGKGSAGGRGYFLMKEFARNGYKSVIITSDSNKMAEVPKLSGPYLLQEVDELELWWVRTLKYRVAKSIRRIMSWVHFEWRLFVMPMDALTKPDVIIVSSLSILTILNGLWLRKRYRSRLVFEVRDIWPLTIIEEGGFSARNPFVISLAWLECLAYRTADEIVGTMPNLREHVATVLGYDRPVGCIPMGIDPTTLNNCVAEPTEYIQKYIPTEKFIVAHVGTIGITNALDTFFESVKLLKDCQKIHFLVVGDGDLSEYYRTKYGDMTNLTFAPKVPKNIVQAILAKCDLLYFSVHESRVWRFGQSLNKVVDYMLSGKPIVASYTGYPSMINEAKCGTYVAAGDVVKLQQEILRYSRFSNAERAELGAKGKKWILTHRNYHNLAKDYLRILFSEK